MVAKVIYSMAKLGHSSIKLRFETGRHQRLGEAGEDRFAKDDGSYQKGERQQIDHLLFDCRAGEPCACCDRSVGVPLTTPLVLLIMQLRRTSLARRDKHLPRHQPLTTGAQL
jgi:hypothetical protein